MKRIKLTVIFLPLMITTVLLTGSFLPSCKTGSCEVRITAGKVDCDDTNCPSPKRCVLSARKKNTELPWKEQSQPVELDTTFEYRCLCKN